MFILAKLVFEHYIPEQLQKGMWFKQKIKDVIYGRVYEYDRIFEINAALPVSPEDFDSFIQVHGYPVRPRIVSITANPDQPAETLVKYDQIGWWDDGEHVEELRDIELKDFNIILSDYDGEIDIDVEPSSVTSDDGVEDEDEIVIPIIYEGKCTLRIPMEEEYEEDYDDYEDWDDMDDLTDDDGPETDSAGFSENDRCLNYNPDDYETE